VGRKEGYHADMSWAFVLTLGKGISEDVIHVLGWEVHKKRMGITTEGLI
jgi:hypothetical protein